MSLITAHSLSKSFGAEDLFHEVSFSIAKGARFALVGPNGIGKTTLLRILMGLEEPSAGKVTRAKSLRIGYLPQEADFQLEGTVWDACITVFADLIRQQGELEKLESEMSDHAKREQAMVRYGTLQEDFERRGSTARVVTSCVVVDSALSSAADTVMCAVFVRPDRTIRSVRLFPPYDNDADLSALLKYELGKRWRFEPATLEGRAYDDWVLVRVPLRRP